MFMALQSHMRYNKSAPAMVSTSRGAANLIRRLTVESIPHASGIYQILCVPTDKVYVGSSSDLYRRWNHHQSLLRRGRHYSRYLQSAWIKYGTESFVFSVLEFVPIDSLVEREQYYLDTLHACDPSIGFNTAPVAKSLRGIPRTPEWAAKIGATHRGVSVPEHVRAKIRSALVGQVITEETRQKISKAVKGIPRTPEWNEKVRLGNMGNKNAVGYKWPAELLEQRASKVRGKPLHPSVRAAQIESAIRTWRITTPDGEVLVIRNLSAFCRERGLTMGCMHDVAMGRQKSGHHKGYRCEQIDEVPA
jgi:group I intron endonuclease